MADQTSPSVPEKIATHKPTVQKWVLGVGGGTFLILTILLVAQVMSNVGKKNAPPESPVVTEDKQQQAAPATGASERFFSQVDNRVRINENEKVREAISKGEPIPGAPAEQLIPGTNTPMPKYQSDALARLNEKRERLWGKAEMEEAGPAGAKQASPEDKFKEEERLRALKSRTARATLKLDKQAATGGMVGSNNALGSLTEPLREGASIEERKAEVRQKLEDARRLRESIENGTYNPAGVAETNQPTRPVNVQQAMANAQRVNSTQGDPAISRSNFGSTDVVGMTRTNMDAENRDREGLSLLATGTVLDGVLSMTTMSDYLGTIKGLITKDVYDINYETILIPKGSQILIKSVNASNVNLPINARLGLTVPWIILPDGRRIDFSRTAALDHMGIGAIKDKVNYHFMAQFLGVAAYAILASETERDTSSQITGQTDIQGDINESIRKQFAPLAARYLTLVPTITLRSGTPFKIIIEDDIYLKPWGTVYDNLYSSH